MDLVIQILALLTALVSFAGAVATTFPIARRRVRKRKGRKR